MARSDNYRQRLESNCNHCVTHVGCLPNAMTITNFRRRRRRNFSRLIEVPIFILFLHLPNLSLKLPSSVLVEGGDWTNGPEDNFFCGFKWDDPNCRERQHCPSGRHEECELHEEGQKCFAYTDCDTKFGDGDGYVPTSGARPPPRPSPGGGFVPQFTGISPDATDHYFCGIGFDDAKSRCVKHCPRGKSEDCPHGHICYFDALPCDARNIGATFPPSFSLTPPGGPPSPATPEPTDPPSEIPPPPPFEYPSDDPTDHWFCGIGIDDANNKCKIHCPTAIECPVNQICYFGTSCDGRTHSPTPPPTRRPTPFPTLPPTPAPTPTPKPTFTAGPSPFPSWSLSPTVSPSDQIPTRSPTTSPTKRPTFAPISAVVASFFCGANWSDATTGCRQRCPSGEDPECPEGEFCFAYTGCTEVKGVPEPQKEDTDSDSGEVEACVSFEVVIVADNWPQEVSWVLENQAGNEVTSGTNEKLVVGEAVSWLECIKEKECYEFTINDTGGDGLCCSHGEGSYQVKFNGREVRYGSAFYDNESTEFGRCGETSDPTRAPTPSPTHAPTAAPQIPKRNSGISGGGGPGSLAYRCVATPLIDSGYVVARELCDRFVDCYNKWIDGGDNWFCDDTSRCVETPSCNGDDVQSLPTKTPPPTGVPSASPTGAPTPPPTHVPSASPTNAVTPPPTHVPSASPVGAVTPPRTGVPSASPAGAVTPPRTGVPSASPAGAVTPPRTGVPSASPASIVTPPPTASPSTPPTSGSVRNSVTSPDTETLPNNKNRPSPSVVAQNPPHKADTQNESPGGNSATNPSNNLEEKATANLEEKATANLEEKATANTKEEATDKSKQKATANTKQKAKAETKQKVTDKPTESPSSLEPTFEPTPFPTFPPTFGPCGGARCREPAHCRSRYGFCGPGSTYCNEKSIWTKDCVTSAPTASPTTQTPTVGPVTQSPTVGLTTLNPTIGLTTLNPTMRLTTPNPTMRLTTPNPTVDSTATSSVVTSIDIELTASPIIVTTSSPTTALASHYQKPSGGKKNVGGKESPSRPVRTNSPRSSSPTDEPTADPSNSPTLAPAASNPNKEIASKIPWNDVGQTLYTPAPYPFATNMPTGSPTIDPTIFPTPDTTPSPPQLSRTKSPTKSPLSQPSSSPLSHPSNSPLSHPSNSPLSHPSNSPLSHPSNSPLSHPSISPLSHPSSSPLSNSLDPEIQSPPSENASAGHVQSDAPTIQPTAEYVCSGDPCPVNTHCRSRYGSCGPGFIYCNSLSIWDLSCPPVIPGTRPTRGPTPLPSMAPLTLFIAPNPITSSTDEKNPTLPPIAKPTLPTITDATPFQLPSSSSISAQITDLGQSSVKESDKLNNYEHEEKNTNEPSDSPKGNPFQSDEYLDGWGSYKSSWSDSAANNHEKCPLLAIAHLLVFLSLLMY